MEAFEGKVAVISGAASGIGRAMADRFGAAGMRLVLADIEKPALDGAVAELEAAGSEAIGVPTDVSDSDEVEETVDIEKVGRQDIGCHGRRHIGQP